jgi:Mg2+-importing ATPase
VIENYWSLAPEQIVQRLGCSLDGLSTPEAEKRLVIYGRNQIREHAQLSGLRVLWSQLRNPLLLLLVFAAAASMFTGEWADAIIVLAIVVVSSGIGGYREYRAGVASAALEARIRVRGKVVRDGTPGRPPSTRLCRVMWYCWVRAAWFRGRSRARKRTIVT